MQQRKIALLPAIQLQRFRVFQPRGMTNTSQHATAPSVHAASQRFVWQAQNGSMRLTQHEMHCMLDWKSDDWSRLLVLHAKPQIHLLQPCTGSLI